MPLVTNQWSGWSCYQFPADMPTDSCYWFSVASPAILLCVVPSQGQQLSMSPVGSLAHTVHPCQCRARPLCSSVVSAALLPTSSSSAVLLVSCSDLQLLVTVSTFQLPDTCRDQKLSGLHRESVQQKQWVEIKSRPQLRTPPLHIGCTLYRGTLFITTLGSDSIPRDEISR